MSSISPTHPISSSAEHSRSRRRRRRQIIVTYAAYAMTVILASVRAHATLGSSARAVLMAAFGLAAVIFIASLVWLVGPSVRYGLSSRTYRRPARGELKTLRDQGVSAKEAHAMFTRPADERQRAIREHAQAVAYRILGPVIVVLALYVIFATPVLGHAWLPSTQSEQVGLLAGFALLFSTLPAAVIAWSEPDPVPDELT
jgi:hypothetical protein